MIKGHDRSGRNNFDLESSFLNSLDLDGLHWYQLPLGIRNEVVRKLQDSPEKLVALSKEIGLNTGSTTGFGRSFDILQASLPFIRSNSTGSTIRVIDIGPGMAMPSIVEMCHHLNVPITDARVDRQFAYEPFEIVVALKNYGFTETQLTAYDIDPLVLGIIDTQKSMVIERFIPEMEHYYRGFISDVDTMAEPILGREMHKLNEENVEYPNEHYIEAHLVELPASLTEPVTTEQGDIGEDHGHLYKYDLIYYMAVDIYIKDRVEALRNVVSKTRSGGIIITSEVEDHLKYGIEELTRVPWKTPKVCYRKMIR